MMFFLKKIPFLNQIKSIFVYFMEKVPRLSQTQRWFTEYYSVDSVTTTDMRSLNKVKKILSFEFSIGLWIGRQGFYRPFQGVESYEPGCAGCDQRTFSHGSIVSTSQDMMRAAGDGDKQLGFFHEDLGFFLRFSKKLGFFWVL